MKKLVVSALTTVCFSCFALQAFSSESCGISAEEALQKLKSGNKRFVEMKLKHPDQSTKRRNELTQGQHPFATILSCSDSRVVDEILFDQGLGDLFVIRNAGNIIDDHVIGSVEYAIVHAGTKLVVVMGHENCGAVGATVCHAKESSYIESIEKAIEPAIKVSKGEGADFANDVSKNNAKLVVKTLYQNPIISKCVKEHDVKIIPAYYNLHTGKVEFLN